MFGRYGDIPIVFSVECRHWFRAGSLQHPVVAPKYDVQVEARADRIDYKALDRLSDHPADIAAPDRAHCMLSRTKVGNSHCSSLLHLFF